MRQSDMDDSTRKLWKVLSVCQTAASLGEGQSTRQSCWLGIGAQLTTITTQASVRAFFHSAKLLLISWPSHYHTDCQGFSARSFLERSACPACPSGGGPCHAAGLPHPHGARDLSFPARAECLDMKQVDPSSMAPPPTICTGAGSPISARLERPRPPTTGSAAMKPDVYSLPVAAESCHLHLAELLGLPPPRQPASIAQVRATTCKFACRYCCCLLLLGNWA